LKKQIAEKAPHLLFLEFHHAKDKLFNLWVHIGMVPNLIIWAHAIHYNACLHCAIIGAFLRGDIIARKQIR